MNIIPGHVCSCGAPIKNGEHYFFECPLYTNQRNNLFINLHRLQIHDADVAVLTARSHNYYENILGQKETPHIKIKNIAVINESYKISSVIYVLLLFPCHTSFPLFY